jgi:flagellar protein FlgJ
MAGISGINTGMSFVSSSLEASKTANLQTEMSRFQKMVEAEVVEQGRLNGDYTSTFSGTYNSDADKNALPSGAAANSGNSRGITEKTTIDKTSKLYEKSLELESYLVKIMLSSMRSSIAGTGISGSEKSYAQNMYEDMLYDELAVSMTKNAGFGLADQIYMQLA